MNSLIVDTNVVSYFMRGHSLADFYRELVEGHSLCISFMTLAEMYEEGFRAKWNDRRWALWQDELTQYIVLPSTPDICRYWGEVRAERRLRPISPEDAWIAATALAHSCPLVTHDASDFEGITGLKILTAD